MSALRKNLIRLAYARPDIRSQILPLLRQAAATPEGAKSEFERYKEQHPKTKKTPHDFLESDSAKSESEGKKKIPDKVLEGVDPDVQKTVKEDYKLDIVGDDAEQAVEIAQRMKAGIEKAADICKISPPVCKENKGLTRDKMPQIEGEKSVKDMLASDKPDEKAKGEAMVQAGADPKSDKTVLQSMLEHFEKNGVKTKLESMPVGKMKATQSEIKAAKVFGMADAHLKGKFDNIDASVVVSSDGHILDGHHRWAALLTIDPSRKMKVKKIDMTMDELLKESASFPGVYKADFNGDPLAKSDQEEYKSKNKSRWEGAKKEARLFSQVVRLAYAKPNFRSSLLPLLRNHR